MRKKNPDAFEKDHRHFLYRQYLRILKKFKPSIFIMENVKGLLSSKINDELIFNNILRDLKLDGEYTIHSVSTPSDEVNDLKPSDYIVRAENFGVPQSRHRVILLGVRNKSGFGKPNVLQPKPAPNVYSLLSDLPRLTSALSKNRDDKNLLEKILKDGVRIIEASDVSQEIKKISRAALAGRIPKAISDIESNNSKEIMSWIKDKRVKTVLNHIPRAHMGSDIQRYFFAACYAAATGISPKLKDFPKRLLPNHKNVHIDTKTFGDRFRVQVAGMTATTILSHIAKDGHYYIHPDPTQYRSFTVREAARLQTFPDNYFFEGQRTQQYSQVGNAVPPFLALQIAEVVANLIRHRKKQRS